MNPITENFKGAIASGQANYTMVVNGVIGLAAIALGLGWYPWYLEVIVMVAFVSDALTVVVAVAYFMAFAYGFYTGVNAS
ncbi:hypothetical protein [Vibrio phage KSF1]|uniref:Uncharacterized protein ORF IV n=1 Tax=Vibrio phage KSF1 TaxID=292443 RepID=Q64EV5_9VIRU|nr:hypothetical protein KSF-1phigpORFIV [Vibrio phage KSF1]AAU14799.1 hypothetical protein [Vibrio phage KSF1]